MTNVKSYKFESYTLEVRERRLLKNGVEVSLAGKRFDILLALVENTGRMVKKDLILDRIWPDKPIEESNLSQHIFHLRRLFEKDSPGINFIVTIPGLGYMFYPQVIVTKEDGDRQTIGRFQPTETTPVNPQDWNVGSDALLAVIRSSAATSRLISTKSIITFAILLMAALGTIYFYKKKGPDRLPNPPTVVPLVTLPGLKNEMRFSPDGRYLAFGNEGDKVESINIYLKSIADDTVTRLTSHTGNDHSFTWSPDNREIAFLRWTSEPGRKNVILILPVTGGTEREIGEAWGGLDWSPDGTLLAISDSTGPQSRSNGIYLVKSDGTERRAVTQPDPDKSIIDDRPRFSPDGKMIAFTRWINGSSDIVVADLKTGKVRNITSAYHGIIWLEWSPSGREIIFASNRSEADRLWRISIDGGKPVLVAGVTDEVAYFSISGQDQSLAYSSNFKNTVINVLPIDTEHGPQNFTVANNSSTPPASEQGTKIPDKKIFPCKIDSTRSDDSSEFSPDGSKIAFMSSRAGFADIWIANSDCTYPIQLTSFRQYSVGSPKWSPDGTRLAFDRVIKGQTDVFTIDISTRRLTQLTNNQENDYLPTWSHDGRSIYFTTDRFGASQIMKVGTEGGEESRVTKDGGFESKASDDGRYLYYTRNRRLFVKDLTTGTEQQIPELATSEMGRYWTLNRSDIFFMVPEVSGNIRIVRFNLANHTITPLMKLKGWPSKFSGGFSVTADGRLLAISLIDYNTNGISLVRNWM